MESSHRAIFQSIRTVIIHSSELFSCLALCLPSPALAHPLPLSLTHSLFSSRLFFFLYLIIYGFAYDEFQKIKQFSSFSLQFFKQKFLNSTSDSLCDCVCVCMCVLLQLCRHRKILNYIICSLKYRSGKYNDGCYIIITLTWMNMLGMY